MEASSSIWKMFSGATGAAKNIWSKATKWKTGNELVKDGKNPADFFKTEGRSNHGSLDVGLEEYHSWPTSSYLAKENSEQGTHQIDYTPVEQELVYFVPNPEAPQFVKTDFLPSPPDQSQIEKKNPINIGETSDQPAIDVFYGEKTDFVPAQTYDYTDAASPDAPGREFDSQNWLIPASNFLGTEGITGEAENSQLFTSLASDLTIREPEWTDWGEEELLPPSELSQTRTWTGERRSELPAMAEMVAEELVAMEEQEEEQEVKERRIQELALHLLHDEAILAEG